MISFSHTDKPRAMHEHDVLEVLKHVVGGSGLGRGLLRARGRMGCRVWAEVLAWSGLTRGCGLGVDCGLVCSRSGLVRARLGALDCGLRVLAGMGCAGHRAQVCDIL